MSLIQRLRQALPLRRTLLLPSHASTAPAAAASPEGLFDPYTYFPGNTRAWGIVQGWSGRIIRRFDIDIAGRIDGATLMLNEQFRYADGERASRTWRIERAGDDGLTGTADDIVGTATGALGGNAMRWRYTMDIETANRRLEVQFDDWIWQLDSSVLVNRSCLRKFGFKVAEVTIFMQKCID